jgi:hypothetical protein
MLCRTSLCDALVIAANKQDKSPALLESLLTSLLVSFSSQQVTTVGGRAACSRMLSKVSTLSRKGYLGDSPDTLQLLADVVSAFTVLSDSTSSLLTVYPVGYAVSVTLLVQFHDIENGTYISTKEFLTFITLFSSSDEQLSEGGAARNGSG